VTSIEEAAFSGCTSLTTLMIPSSVTNMTGVTFSDWRSLTAIIVSPLNLSYSSVNGVLFNKNQTVLIKFPEGKAGSYEVPNTVTGIASNAFSKCVGLTSVTIPDSVITIGDSAFSDGGGLIGVMIGNGVRNIGDRAFLSCTNLTSVTIPGITTNVGDGAF